MNNNIISLFCKRCFYFPIIIIQQYPRCSMEIKCQCRYHTILNINSYLKLQKKLSKKIKPIIKESKDKIAFVVDSIRRNITKAITIIDNEFHKIENIDKAIYDKCKEENKNVLSFIEIIIQNYSQYKDDFYLQKTMKSNTNIITEIKEDITSSFLEFFSVINYELKESFLLQDKYTTKEVIILNNEIIAILFEKEIKKSIYDGITEMKDINKLNLYQNNKCIIELNTPIEYIFSFPSGQIAMYKGKVNVIEIYHLTNSSLSLDFTISIKESYTRPCAISNDRIATYSSSEIYIYSCFGSGVETISIP